jgi:hypothetical protein
MWRDARGWRMRGLRQQCQIPDSGFHTAAALRKSLLKKKETVTLQVRVSTFGFRFSVSQQRPTVKAA